MPLLLLPLLRARALRRPEAAVPQSHRADPRRAGEAWQPAGPPVLITTGNRGELLPVQFDRFARLGDGIITTYLFAAECRLVRERAEEALARRGCAWEAWDTMRVTLRPGRPEDAERCGGICFEAFRAIAEQHNFPPEFASPDIAMGLMSFLLSRQDVYSVVAESDGRVIGSNFLWESASIAGVGPVTVDPSVQNSQAGRVLMAAVLERGRTQRFAGIRLVQSAYHSRALSLYTKLGFDAREPLSAMQGPPIRQEVPGHAVRAAAEGDLDACNRLCLRVHGHERGRELLDAIRQRTATVVEHGGRITGYATLLGFSGHAVGESNEDLKALIVAAPSFVGPGFLLPTRNGELFRWCLGQGLRVVQPLTLMSLGLYNDPSGAFLPSILY